MTQPKANPVPLGQIVEADVAREELEPLRRLALDMGASAAVIIPADYVHVDERVRLKCLVPRCLRAGETPNCPPNAPSLRLVRRAMGRYSWAVLFKCDITPVEEYAPGSGSTRRDQRRVLSFHKNTGEIVYAVEKRAYQDGYHLAMGLGGGSCKDYLCGGQICQFLDSGRCRFPHRSRPAMEAMGIDVVALITDVGWEAYALVGDLSQIPCAISVGIVFVC